jgi:hypothetical protein
MMKIIGRSMKINTILIYFLVALMGLFACTKEGKAPNSATSPRQQGSPSGVGSQQRSSGNLAIKIIPELPTVMKDMEVQADLPAAGTITYQWKRNGQIIVGEHTARLGKNQFSIGDEITAIVTAGNLEGTVSVVIANNSPKVVSVPFSPEYVHAGMDITVNPVGSDPSGEEVKFHYKWSINGSALPEDSPVLRGDRFKRGDVVTLTVIPYDGAGEGEPFNSKKIVIPDAPPQIVSSPPQNIQTDVYTYQVVAEDPDGDPLTFSLASAPRGMMIDSKTGIITWQIKDTSAGVYGVEIIVQDPEGRQGTQKYTIPIDMPEEGKK